MKTIKGNLIRHFFEIWKLLLISSSNEGIFKTNENNNEDEKSNNFKFKMKKSKWTLINISVLVISSFIQEILIYQIGLITARFYYVLLLKNLWKFYLQLMITFALVLFMSLIKSFRQYLSEIIEIEFREHSSRFFIEKYFKNYNYYLLNAGVIDNIENDQSARLKISPKQPHLDNIDQRLCQDLYQLCKESTIFISKSIILPFIVVYYSHKVFQTVGILGVLICIAIFLLSTFVNKFFLNSIVKWTYLKEKYEGDYRTKHFNIRQNYEHIIFTNTDNKLKKDMINSLRKLLSIHENLALRQFYLNCLTTIFDYSGSIISFIIISIPLFHDEYKEMNEAELSRQISANTFICLYLINCFSRIIDMTSNFATINGIGYRLTELNKSFDLVESQFHDRTKIDDDTKFDEEHNEALYLEILLSNDNNQRLKLYRNENLFINICSPMYDHTIIFKLFKNLSIDNQQSKSISISMYLNINSLNDIMFIMNNLNYGEYFLEEFALDTNKLTAIQSYINDNDEFSILSSIIDNDIVNLKLLKYLSWIQIQLLNIIIAFIIRPKLLIFESLETIKQSLLNDSNKICEIIFKNCELLNITIITIGYNDKNGSNSNYYKKYLKI